MAIDWQPRSGKIENVKIFIIQEWDIIESNLVGNGNKIQNQRFAELFTKILSR